MYINYKKTYLTDGTPVKITEELYNQLRDWERQGYQFHFSYIDLLKQQDDEMINQNRNYYLHNVSLDEQVEKEHPDLLHDKSYSIDEQIIKKDRSRRIMKILLLCSESQRRRFIKHYYLGLSYAEIAEQEQCSKQSVHGSIISTVKLLINCEQFE